MPDGTPDIVKRQMLERLHKRLLPNEPSARLQREVFLQHSASVAELSGPHASRVTKRPRLMRSAVVMSAAPSKQSKASQREYSAWAGCGRNSVAEHVSQRDEMSISGGELYHLVRDIKYDVDKLYYEVQGL